MIGSYIWVDEISLNLRKLENKMKVWDATDLKLRNEMLNAHRFFRRRVCNPECKLELLSKKKQFDLSQTPKIDILGECYLNEFFFILTLKFFFHLLTFPVEYSRYIYRENFWSS